MQSIFFCNQERDERRVLRALREVDWNLSSCFKITLRKIHSSGSSDEPLQKSALAKNSCCPGEAHVLSRRRDSSADSPISHVGSVTAPQLHEQVTSTKTNAKCMLWPHSTCNVIQGGLVCRERGVRACTQQNSSFLRLSKSITLYGKTISHWLNGALQHAN